VRTHDALVGLPYIARRIIDRQKKALQMQKQHGPGFVLETERLILRELALGDAPFILSLLNTPTWKKYIGDRGVNNLADAEKYITNGPLTSYALNNFGLWLVVEKNNLAPIGMCGILKRDALPQPDIGFAFMPESSGLGFGKEIVTACLHYCINTLKLPELLAITTQDNFISQWLLLSVGFAPAGQLEDSAGGPPLRLFRKDLSHHDGNK
jgi:[ribosomal protein S5]-alanine N-acetyltransferase